MSQILHRLAPLNGIDDPWGIVLYIIAVLCFISLMLQKNGGLGITLLLSGGILAAVIDHVATTSGNGAYNGDYFAPVLVRVAIFALPMLAAGLTKQEKSRPTAVIAVILGIVYWILRWTQIPKFDYHFGASFIQILDYIKLFF
jgi:hypothetical protein